MNRPYKNKLIKPWKIVSALIRGLISFLRVWPLLLVVVFILSPITPHLRWSYQYHTWGGEHRVYFNCQYLSINGLSFPDFSPTCPLIVLADRKTGRRYF